MSFNLRGVPLCPHLLYSPVQDVVKILQGAVASNATLDDLTPLATTICVYAIEHLLDLGSYMCPGIVRSYGPVVSESAAANSLVCVSHVFYCKFGLMVIKLHGLTTTGKSGGPTRYVYGNHSTRQPSLVLGRMVIRCTTHSGTPLLWTPWEPGEVSWNHSIVDTLGTW